MNELLNALLIMGQAAIVGVVAVAAVSLLEQIFEAYRRWRNLKFDYERANRIYDAATKYLAGSGLAALFLAYGKDLLN